MSMPFLRKEEIGAKKHSFLVTDPWRLKIFSLTYQPRCMDKNSEVP